MIFLCITNDADRWLMVKNPYPRKTTSKENF